MTENLKLDGGFQTGWDVAAMFLTAIQANNVVTKLLSRVFPASSLDLDDTIAVDASLLLIVFISVWILTYKMSREP